MSLITEKMKGSALRYPARDLRCKQRLITTGSTDFDETISQGVIPRRLWVCMVDQDARAVNYKKNPFNFQHYNLSSIQLRVAGKMVPLEAIQANFGANKYKHLYFNLFSQKDNLFDDRAPVVVLVVPRSDSLFTRYVLYSYMFCVICPPLHSYYRAGLR